uniref:Solute carrier family 12 member 9 n=2 Tax=Hirondellea gigas TaxID=1518452 RepID=A0A6A7FY59_9CRUS
MADVDSSINSTNQQFEASTQQSVFKRSRKLERKPLIGEKCTGASSNGSSAVGGSKNTDDGQQCSADVEQQMSGSNDGKEAGTPTPPPSSSERTLGTADGVFAPVALSQFSSLLFLRVGYLVGNGGLLMTLGLMTGAYSILIFTVLSICAISTNGAVEGGGAYYMISRTLGPEMGGAIGIVFYIANVFSCALYTSGCVEGMLQGLTLAIYPDTGNSSNSTAPTSLELSHGDTYLISLGILVLLLCLCLVGATIFAKCTNVFFYSVTSIALLVFFSMLARSNIVVPYARNNYLNLTKHSGNFTGLHIRTGESNLYPHFSTDYTNGLPITLMSLFSVLFSGVTGIMAGANMSGELKDPSYSIPRGTLAACAVSFLMYTALCTAAAFSTATDVLQNNYVFMSYICFWEPLVYIGIVLATVCAALSNMIGASRILRAIAGDKVFGPVFNFLLPNQAWCGPCPSCISGNEYLGTLLFTFLLSGAVLAIGNMNSIAPYTSVFFLLSYAMINVSCMMLVWAGAPNFRPKFRHFSITTSFIGFVSSVAVMIVLNRKAAFTCMGLFILLLVTLYFYHLKYPSAEMQWGSVGQAVLFHTVRKYLLKLDFRREHVKFWRPHLLLLVANPRSACPLIDTLNDLKKSGIYILGHVQVSKVAPRDLSEEYNRWQALVDHLKVKAFVSVTESTDLRTGALQIVRVSGLGALKPNTVLLGFRDDTQPIDFLTRETSRYCLKSSSSSILCDWLPLVPREEGAVFPPKGSAAHLSTHDYVALMHDILCAGKNLALCRSFCMLDKDNIARRRSHQSYIDVWPINFLCPEISSVEDTTSLFTLQLGTILHMVKFWKKNTGFRVFLLVPHEWSSDYLAEQKCKVKDKLLSVRINAEIEAVSFVPPTSPHQQPEESSGAAADGTRGSDHHPLSDSAAGSGAVGGIDARSSNLSATSDASAYPRQPSSNEEDTDYQLERMTGRYLSSVNLMIRSHSSDSAITFLNIPAPPTLTKKYDMYLDALGRLTQDIGPCIMVHGLSKVTTSCL